GRPGGCSDRGVGCPSMVHPHRRSWHQKRPTLRLGSATYSLPRRRRRALAISPAIAQRPTDLAYFVCYTPNHVTLIIMALVAGPGGRSRKPSKLPKVEPG